MQIAIALPFALALAACGDVGTAERLSSTEKLDGIDVPTIGTVGDFPDPAHRHVINVTADGRLVAEGRDRTFDEMTTLLGDWGDLSRVWLGESGQRIDQPPPNGQALRASTEHLLLRVDGRAPWDTAARLIEGAIDAKIFGIWLTARHEGDGEEGALGFPLMDEAGRLDSRQIGVMTLRCDLGVDVAPGPGDGSREVLYSALRAARPGYEGKLDGWVRVDRKLRTRDVLQLWDAAIRARGLHVGLDWTWAEPPSGIVGPSESSGYTLRFVGTGAPSGTVSALPPVARARGPLRAFYPYLIAPEWSDTSSPKSSPPK